MHWKYSEEDTTSSLAIHAYRFINEFIDRAWAKYRAENWRLKPRKAHFATGVMLGFLKKLEQAKEVENRTDSETRETEALVARRAAQVDRYLHRKYPEARSRSLSHREGDPEVVAAGHAVGAELVIHKPIARSSGNQGRLLRSRNS